ncbi:Acg family FMN-binding oxidoreductase [Nocardioides aurantiacus]|uniref:Acg family FMN-binding oxidoreductase n=1 Tax=Nocardioides aurantiacus TaxID=86796 RepID=UPI00403F9FAE
MSEVTAHVLTRVLELACRAPSVQNTQPWQWRVAGNATLELFTDPTRQLLVSDPDGRNLAISCGAALHHAVTAAEALGLAAQVTLTSPDSDQVAEIHMARGDAARGSRATLSSLEDRYTDRRRFTAWPVPDGRLLELSAAASGWGAYAVPLNGRVERSRIKLIMGRARSIQAADPRLVSEQRQWVSHGPDDGIPEQDASPPSDDRAIQQPTRHQPDSLDTEPELVKSTEGLLALCTAGDDRTSWVRAGQSLSALWLAAHRVGLSVVPLSQAIEVVETRRALREEVFHGGLRPQLLVRVGWQQIGRATLARTPRRPLAEVLIG